MKNTIKQQELEIYQWKMISLSLSIVSIIAVGTSFYICWINDFGL